MPSLRKAANENGSRNGLPESKLRRGWNHNGDWKENMSERGTCQGHDFSAKSMPGEPHAETSSCWNWQSVSVVSAATPEPESAFDWKTWSKEKIWESYQALWKDRDEQERRATRAEQELAELKDRRQGGGKYEQ